MGQKPCRVHSSLLSKDIEGCMEDDVPIFRRGYVVSMECCWFRALVVAGNKISTKTLVMFTVFTVRGSP